MIRKTSWENTAGDNCGSKARGENKHTNKTKKSQIKKCSVEFKEKKQGINKLTRTREKVTI